MASGGSEKERLQRLKVFFGTENNNDQDALAKSMRLLLKRRQLLLPRDDEDTLRSSDFKEKVRRTIRQRYTELEPSFVHTLCEDSKVKEEAFEHLDFFARYQRTLAKKNHVNRTVREKAKALDKNRDKHRSGRGRTSSRKDRKHRRDRKRGRASSSDSFDDDGPTSPVQDKRQGRSRGDSDLESAISTLTIKRARDQSLDASPEAKQDRSRSRRKRRRVKRDPTASPPKSKAASRRRDSHKSDVTEDDDDHSGIDDSSTEPQLVSDPTGAISHKGGRQQAELPPVEDHPMSDASQPHLGSNEEPPWPEHQDDLSAPAPTFSQTTAIPSSPQLTHAPGNPPPDITLGQPGLTTTAATARPALEDRTISADLTIDGVATSRSLNCMWEIVAPGTETGDRNRFSLELWEGLLQEDVSYDSSIHEITSTSDTGGTQVITLQRHFSAALTRLFQSSGSDDPHFIIRMKQFSREGPSLGSQLLQGPTSTQQHSPSHPEVTPEPTAPEEKGDHSANQDSTRQEPETDGDKDDTPAGDPMDIETERKQSNREEKTSDSPEATSCPDPTPSSHPHPSPHTPGANEGKIPEQQPVLNPPDSEPLPTEADGSTPHQSGKEPLDSTDTPQKPTETEDTAQNPSTCDPTGNSPTKPPSCPQPSTPAKEPTNATTVPTGSGPHTSDDKADTDRGEVKSTEQAGADPDHEALALAALKLGVVRQTPSGESGSRSLSDSVTHNRPTPAAEQPSTSSRTSLSTKPGRTRPVSRESDESEDDDPDDQPPTRPRRQRRSHDSLTAEDEPAPLDATPAMSEFSVERFINALGESRPPQNAELQNEHVDEEVNDMYVNPKPARWSLAPAPTGDPRAESLTFHLLRFEEFRNELVLTQIASVNWTDFTSFFKREPDELKAQDATHILPGLHVGLKPHQLFAVYWMLVKGIEENGGGFIADEQGLGKTLTAIATMVVQRLISMAQQEVVIDRENGDDSRHLSLEQSQLPDAVCPSDPFPFPCPCLKKNKTSSLHIKRGPVLIVAPAKLVPNWVGEFEKFIDATATFGHSDRPIDMTLLVAHNDTKADHCPRLGSSWQSVLNANPDPDDASLFTYSNYEVNRVLILTTLQSYKANVEDILHVNVTPPRPARGKGSRSHQIPQYEDRVHWSNVVYDEAHEVKSMSSQSMQLMLGLKGNPYAWFMTGTPFEVSALDLQSFFSVVGRDVQNPKRPSKQQLVDLDRAFRENARSSSDPRTLAALGKALEKFRVALGQFMIRRLVSTRWFNQAIVKLPPHYREDIPTTIPSGYETFFARLETRQDIDIRNRMSRGGKQTLDTKKLASNFVFRSSYAHQLRMSATCPHLAQLCVEHKLQLTMDEYRSHGWIQKPQQSPYYQNISDIVRSSAKFSKLKEIIVQKMQSRKAGRMEKIVILSAFPVAVICVEHVSKPSPPTPSSVANPTSNVQLFFFRSQWLQKYHPNVKFIALHSYMKVNERQDLVDTFQTDDEHMVIIGTTGIMGTGMTLTRATTLVLLEPDYTLGKEKQAYSRNYRIGQDRPTHAYRLVSTNSRMEQLILNKQKKRALMQKETMERTNDDTKGSARVKQKETELRTNNGTKTSARVDLTLPTQIIDLD